ncbi:hypothetical protein MBLNU457_g0557t1 [Dothideomycetes sp. NU457]
MAQNVDVNAILAALAAQQQRSSGTPSQPTPAPPQGLPQGFPPGFPQPTGTPSAGGFSLPQPTQSGSIDLSSVRPVSTGQVSINDAVAKARNIAASLGISANQPPRDDPRLAGRGYRRSRSRSRSPGRRDNFRDGNNPYRDERRRDDRRSYGRDRSLSPRRGGGNSFSPRGGGGRGGGGDDGDSETITVKSALVGLIIGRAGENLRRVEAETQARVQFIPAQPGASTRQCTLSGPVHAREAAKRDIFRTIEENGGGGGVVSSSGGRQPSHASMQKESSLPPLRDGEKSRQILVPDKTVGLIIGRGGETIRDLQDRSGCHVNIVAENKSINGKRPVNLIGSNEAAARAEALIWEIVDSDTRIAQDQRAAAAQGPPQRGYDSYGGGGGGRDDGKTEESIYVPSEAVGMIIGKGGETIKQMQNHTGCKINVNQPQQPDIQRKIDLVGSRSAIEAAKRVIDEKVDTVQQRDREKGQGRRDDYDGGYQQRQAPPQQQHQQSATPSFQMPSMPNGAAAPPADPNAPDPYAQYGGYQNYVALWYASMMAQNGGQQPPPAQ